MKHPRTELTPEQRHVKENRRAEIYARLAEIDPYEPTGPQSLEKYDLLHELSRLQVEMLPRAQCDIVVSRLGDALWEAYNSHGFPPKKWVSLDILNRDLRYDPRQNPDGIPLQYPQDIVAVLGAEILEHIDVVRDASRGNRYYLHSNLTGIELEGVPDWEENRRKDRNNVALDPTTKERLKKQYQEEEAVAAAYHTIRLAEYEAKEQERRQAQEVQRQQQEAEEALYFDAHTPADYIRRLDRRNQIFISRGLADLLVEKWQLSGLKAAVSGVSGSKVMKSQKVGFYELERPVHRVLYSEAFPVRPFKGTGVTLLRITDYLRVFEREIVAYCFMKIAEQQTKRSYGIGVRLVVDENENLAWLETKFFKNEAEFENRNVAEWPCDYHLAD